MNSQQAVNRACVGSLTCRQRFGSFTLPFETRDQRAAQSVSISKQLKIHDKLKLIGGHEGCLTQAKTPRPS